MGSNRNWSKMSKVSRETLYEAVEAVLKGSAEKKRNFKETVELQITLKNYDPQKDKRFSGTVKLPNVPRPNQKICIIGDAAHNDEAEAKSIPHMSADDLSSSTRTRNLSKSSPRNTMLSLLLSLSSSRSRVFSDPVLTKPVSSPPC